MDFKLQDKVALVTGAGGQKGYGRNIATTLAGEGCHIIVADLDMPGARLTAAEVEALGREALAVEADVRQRDQVEAMVKTAVERFGRIDILVNNAGASSREKPFMEMSQADWDLDIQVNLVGQMNVARAVLPHMIKQRYGRIINTTGGRGIPMISIYGAAKAGIVAWTHSLAGEVAQFGIIVNGISPGLGETGLTARAPQEFKEALIRNSMLKRFCRPADVGPAVAFLASDVCSYMTGQFLELSTF